jgi:hypothetical protein
MACPELGLEILRHRLTPCYYVALYRRHCGEIRAAVPEAPSDRFHPCPVCRRDCEYALQGEGGTHRALPFCGKTHVRWSLRSPMNRDHKAVSVNVLHSKVRNALIDSFTATLSMPESQEEINQRRRSFALEHEPMNRLTKRPWSHSSNGK